MNKIETIFLTKHIEEDEEVFFVIHKHWIEFLKPFLKWVLLICIVCTGIFFYGGDIILPALGGLLFLFFILIYDFLDWYLDVILLTNMNIVNAEWKGLFSNSSSRMAYESIESVSYEHDGFFSSFLNYGDIHIERESGILSFHNTDNPKKAEIEVLEVKNALFGHGHLRNSDISMDALKNLLSQLIDENMNNGSHGNVAKRGFKRK